MSTNIRTTKRVAAAAAGFALVAASFAGAASASAADSHHAVPGRHSTAGTRIYPRAASRSSKPLGSSAGLSATATPVTTTVQTLAGGASVAAPTVTITDPGVLGVDTTLHLTLGGPHATAVYDTSHLPVVTENGSGAIVGTASFSGSSLDFTVTKSDISVQATYTVSGIYFDDTPSAQAGGLYILIGSSAPTLRPGLAHPGSARAVHPDQPNPSLVVGVATVTDLLPAYYGQTAPDTAAKLFAAHVTTGAPTSVVLASDYEPQDAESANYLATNLAGSTTGILLTNPTTLSPAVTDTFTAYPSITDVYIVGGTSVVSAAIETQLDAQFGASHVIRLAGATAYQTNMAIISYVTTTLNRATYGFDVDFATEANYNNTSGKSSPSTTVVGTSDPKTAIVASGNIDAFQDGIVSGPLSFDYRIPVVLTTRESISDAALAVLAQGGYQQVILLGGPGAVSDAVVDQITAPVSAGGAGLPVFRIAGTDASDTAQLFARFQTDGTGSNIEMYTTDDEEPNGGVLIARGTGFQDALTAGAYAGWDAYTPILLTENASTLGAPLASYLKTVADQYDTYSVEAIGGPYSVNPATQTDAIAAEVSGFLAPTP